MNIIEIPAYGKINLALAVTGRRPDGYHELETVFQRISLCDHLSVSKTEDGCFTLQTNLQGVPAEKNIIARAYHTLKDKFPQVGGLSVMLKKNIPTQAGLGGGSADCAAFLMAVNKLYELGLTTQELMQLGAGLGADVPACLLNGAAVGQGIGEHLTPVASRTSFWLTVVKPPVAFSTPAMFQKLDAPSFAQTQRFTAKESATALEQGDLDRVCQNLYNVFEAVAETPVIQEIKTALLAQGAKGSLMTGSGSCVFGIFEEEVWAQQAAQALSSRWQTFVCHSQNEGCTL